MILHALVPSFTSRLFFVLSSLVISVRVLYLTLTCVYVFSQQQLTAEQQQQLAHEQQLLAAQQQQQHEAYLHQQQQLLHQQHLAAHQHQVQQQHMVWGLGKTSVDGRVFVSVICVFTDVGFGSQVSRIKRSDVRPVAGQEAELTRLNRFRFLNRVFSSTAELKAACKEFGEFIYS